jgi:hypothetical protein
VSSLPECGRLTALLGKMEAFTSVTTKKNAPRFFFNDPNSKSKIEKNSELIESEILSQVPGYGAGK